MKLHYSQTESACCGENDKFYYLMKLHYSQTNIPDEQLTVSFTTL